MKNTLIVCAAVLLLASNVWADTVTFKSGKQIEGNIKSITNDSVTVELYGVTDMTYDLADIKEINGQPVGANKPAVSTATESAAEAAIEAPAPEPVAPATDNVSTASAQPTEPPLKTADAVTPNVTQQEEMPSPAMGQIPKINLSDKQAKTFLAALGMFVTILLFVLIILYIYSAICLQTIAKKTGTEYGWMAWIPIANLFLMCNIGKVRYFWLFLLLAAFIPVVGRFVGTLCNLALFGYLWYMIAVARGKQGWIGIITAVPVVGLFTMGYLAFSKDENVQGAVPLPNIGGGQPAKPLGTAPLMKPPIE